MPAQAAFVFELKTLDMSLVANAQAGIIQNDKGEAKLPYTFAQMVIVDETGKRWRMFWPSWRRMMGSRKNPQHSRAYRLHRELTLEREHTEVPTRTACSWNSLRNF